MCVYTYICIIRIICRRYVQTKRNEIKRSKCRTKGHDDVLGKCIIFRVMIKTFRVFLVVSETVNGRRKTKNKNKRSGRRNSVRRAHVLVARLAGGGREVVPRAFNCIVENATAVGRKSNLSSNKSETRGGK